MTEMHDVVEMLLTRMKDYPEDFVGAPSRNRYQIGMDTAPTKWGEAMSMINEVLTDEERDAIETAYKEAKRAVYMGAALKKMLSSDDEDGVKLNTGTHPNRILNPSMATTGLSHAQLMPTSVSTTNTNIITAIQEQQKLLEEQMKQTQIQNEYRNAIIGS